MPARGRACNTRVKPLDSSPQNVQDLFTRGHDGVHMRFEKQLVFDSVWAVTLFDEAHCAAPTAEIGLWVEAEVDVAATSVVEREHPAKKHGH